MKANLNIILTAWLITTGLSASAMGQGCPYDHVRVGCNPDGITYTGQPGDPNDDYQLFFDCADLYRHSDPNRPGEATWYRRHQPLGYSQIYGDYFAPEPGFSANWQYPGDPHQPAGTAGTDYELWIECLAISSINRFRGVGEGFTLDQVGDRFCLSDFAQHHAHMKYRADQQNALYWVRFQLYDAKGKYEPSKPVTFVFGQAPVAGDICVDGDVNLRDLAKLSHRWLQTVQLEAPDWLTQARTLDHFDRCDIDLDGQVDLWDLSLIAITWLTPQP